MSRDQMSGDQIGMEIICECAAGDQMRMKIERPRSNVRDQMSGDQSSGDQMRTTRTRIMNGQFEKTMYLPPYFFLLNW